MGEEKFNASKFPAAGKILVELMTSPDFHEFLTLDAYAVLGVAWHHVAPAFSAGIFVESKCPPEGGRYNQIRSDAFSYFTGKCPACSRACVRPECPQNSRGTNPLRLGICTFGSVF